MTSTGLLLRKSICIPTPLNLSFSHALNADLFSLASEHQYKYHINKKWKLKKNLPTPKKAALYQHIQKRAQLGKPSVVTRGGKNVDTKNLRRYLKTEARRAITLRPVARVTVGNASSLLGHSTPFGNRMLGFRAQ